MSWDPEAARARLQRLWNLDASFGMERTAYHVYLNEVVRDRYVLLNGLQILRDELQLAHNDSALGVCATDLRIPSVLTTLAHTHCGDRIHHGEAKHAYEQVVASRFAALSEIGGVKLESFTPAGGGIDDGPTLAHVTVAHQIDERLRERIYGGNASSFVLVNVDLQTHVGRDDVGDLAFGHTRETPWREPRNACGAIVGALEHYHGMNGVHRRIRTQLGEENYALLSGPGVKTEDGVDITAVVAAAIIAVRGMELTLSAFTTELDERGLAHVTASLCVNRVSLLDTVIYLARGTVFDGALRVQGFGTEARFYGGRIVDHEGDRRLVLSYEGRLGATFPIARSAYPVRTGALVLGDEVIDI